MSELDTKERIRQHAHNLIMQYGIRSVSMDDIANSMGISKKTIYQFYADKDELVCVVVEDLLSQNKVICEMDRSESKDAIDELFMAKECIGDMLKAMNPSLLYDLQKYHPGAFIMFQKHRTEFLFNIIRRNVERGISEDVFREDLKVELVSRLRVESLLIPFNPEFQVHTRYTLLEMQEELIELYLFSLVNLKGHKLVLKYKQQYQQKQ